jgi:hypothetical protein
MRQRGNSLVNRRVVPDTISSGTIQKDAAVNTE